MEINKLEVLGEIKGFLDGYNDELKYLVNVETDPNTNIAECVIHEPGQKPKIIKVEYEPFMYMKDLEKLGRELFVGKTDEMKESMAVLHGIKIEKLKTGNQKRLVDGYCYKLTSRKSYNAIVSYLRDGGINPFDKLYDPAGKVVRDKKGDIIYPNRDLFYAPKTTEQFFISTQSRLYKGYEEYNNVHRVTYDIETTGLRYEISRLFAIGVRDNRGFEIILEVEKVNDDESEIKLIQDFFNIIIHLKPAVVCGYFSEGFDIDYILGRAKELKMNLDGMLTSLNKEIPIRRKGNVSVKYGNTTDKYTATEMWGISFIDILHAAKRTAAVNSDIKETGLKYIAKFEKIARPNRTYIDGEDNGIGKYYYENKIFLINAENNYTEIPNNFQETAKKLYKLQINKSKLSDEEYGVLRKKYLNADNDFIGWFREVALPKNHITFINGKNLVKQYLLDDLWETEQVDELYNQSSFLLAKIVPTTYQRICTMGTASIWNLLLTTWSYENGLAIPAPDKYTKFSGGLARTYKSGYSERLIKIDYASLYPMIQLTEGVFPIFDITGVMQKMLLYLTTTRNIYKKMGSGAKLNNEELTLLKEIDPDVHIKYINDKLTDGDISMFKVKQLPIKILNNSLYGALGSHISFNWSDNVCAARITCVARLRLRQAIYWFSQFGCVALLAVTDGINFQIPDKTTIRITDDGVVFDEPEGLIEDMWEYKGKKGIQALIEKFNEEEMPKPFMSVDDDGESISCLNLARINYATLSWAKNKKTGEKYKKIKLTGNTIKSDVMPEYIEEFIDVGLDLILHGRGKEFVDYYQDYAENIVYMRIPLKKIASKSRIKQTIGSYLKRGKDKNGREKGKQAHMELLIEHREQVVRELFEKHKHEFDLTKIKDLDDINTIMKLVALYMPPEPELDSMVYYVNTGYRKSHGDSKEIKDKESGELRMCTELISAEAIHENPDLIGKYNYEKYLSAFNERVKTILVGFDSEIREKILVTINKKGELTKEMFTKQQLELKSFDFDDFDESMHIEPMEVDFWNKTGYDPRKVWDGFKMFDDYKVHFEIYESALNHLNQKMTAANKPSIKSINDDYKKGDLVLIKDGGEYHVGAFNGVYIQIIKDNVDVPKSELELRLDEEREEREKKIKELETSELSKKSKEELSFESEIEKREKYFKLFLENFKLPPETTMTGLFSESQEAVGAFESFIKNMDAKLEGDVADYGDIDIDDDGEY